MIQLSYSASNRYKMSPRSYYLHYILRLRPEKVGSALVFGSAVDEGLNSLLEGKDSPESDFLKSWEKADINGVKVDLKTSNLVKYSKSDYDEHILTDEDLSLIQEGLNKSWVSLRRKGLMIIQAYREQIIPRIKKVIEVQKYVKLTNEHGDSFIGWVDFICEWEDGKVYIVDNKTTSIKYKKDSASTSPQLATYFEGVSEEGKVEAHGVMYIAVPKKFRKRKKPLIPIEVIIGEVSEELLEETFQEYDESLHGIKMGDFPCTGCRDNVFGCVYKTYCESDGHDLTGLTFVKKGK